MVGEDGPCLQVPIKLMCDRKEPSVEDFKAFGARKVMSLLIRRRRHQIGATLREAMFRSMRPVNRRHGRVENHPTSPSREKPWSAVANAERHRFQMQVDPHPPNDCQSVSGQRTSLLKDPAIRTAPIPVPAHLSRMSKWRGASLHAALQGKCTLIRNNHLIRIRRR